MKRLTGVFVIILSVILYSNAQNGPVTNADLEKYRLKRVAAEQELQDKYAEMGFPSPDALERKRERETKERIAFADTLRADRLEREKADAELQKQAYAATQAYAAAVASQQPNYIVIDRQEQNTSYPYWSYSYPTNDWNQYYRRYPGRYGKYDNNIGWRAGGGGIIFEPGRNNIPQTPVYNPRYNFPFPGIYRR
ncbi:MAG: hypothetical protein ACJ72Z_07095 [Pyrinomonadaceae bacterium]